MTAASRFCFVPALFVLTPINESYRRSDRKPRAEGSIRIVRSVRHRVIDGRNCADVVCTLAVFELLHRQGDNLGVLR